jgi:RNA polymerase sigma-70 factor, ECF subfamily
VTNRAAAAHRRHTTTVSQYVRRQTRSRDDAEDLTQTVSAEAIDGLKHGAAGSQPEFTWLHTVAQRQLIDQRRRLRTPAARAVSLCGRPVGRNYKGITASTSRRPTLVLVAALPAEQRRVVVLQHVEGRRFAEVAAELSVSEGACRPKLSRALRTLRAHFQQEGPRP